ncbi:MAG: glycosyltransferase family 2 protein [Candidatus Eremiobacterota bacterium]
MGFRRDVLKELGGFSNEFPLSEDMDISCRAGLNGYEQLFIPHASVLHNHNRISLPLMLKSAFRTGCSSILLRNKYSKLMNTPFILRSPLLIFLTSPLIALKATGDIYLKNSYLRNFVKTFPVVYMLKMAWSIGAFVSLRKQKIKEKEIWKKI